MKTIYLFLDVDGVLNNQKIIQETKKMQVIDEQNLINLNKLIKTIKKEDNCSIILNSSWQLVNENIDILKSYLNKKTDDFKPRQETKVLADEIINDYENNKLVIMNQIRNILEFINEPNKQIYLNDLKSLLRNAPIDYEKNPKGTIELWGLYSKYKDASDYYRITNKK